MPHQTVKKLFDSISELERSINLAKSTFAASPALRKDLLERVSQYDKVLTKQRQLAAQLSDHIENEQWDEVARLVRVINGLSSLIHEDARSLLAEVGSAGREPGEPKAAQ